MEEKQKNIFYYFFLSIDILKKIKSKIIYVFIIGILFASIGYLLAYFSKPDYTGETTFILSDEDMNTSNNQMSQLAMLMPGMSGKGNNKEMLKEILSSKKIIEFTLLNEAELYNKKDLLVNHFIRNENMHFDKKKKSYDNSMLYNKDYKIGTDTTKDAILRGIASSIGEATSAKLTDGGIFKFTFTNHNEHFTKQYIDKFIETVIKYYSEKRMKKSLSFLKYVQNKHDSLLAVLSGKEVSYASIADVNPFVNRAKLATTEIQGKRSMTVTSGLYSEAVKNLEMAKYAVERETPMIQVIDDARLPLLMKGKSKIKNTVTFFIIGIILSLTYFIAVLLLKNKFIEEKNNYKNIILSE